MCISAALGIDAHTDTGEPQLIISSTKFSLICMSLAGHCIYSLSSASAASSARTGTLHILAISCVYRLMAGQTPLTSPPSALDRVATHHTPMASSHDLPLTTGPHSGRAGHRRSSAASSLATCGPVPSAAPERRPAHASRSPALAVHATLASRPGGQGSSCEKTLLVPTAPPGLRALRHPQHDPVEGRGHRAGLPHAFTSWPPPWRPPWSCRARQGGPGAGRP